MGRENLLSTCKETVMAQRPRRTPKPPPLSYWEEFVETDSWYLKKIVEDVPEEELHAALVDEDYTL